MYLQCPALRLLHRLRRGLLCRSSAVLPTRDGSSKVTPVIGVEYRWLAVEGQHVDASLCAEGVHPDVAARALNSDDVLLAVVGEDAVLRVVFEEGVEAGAVYVDVRGAEDAETEGLDALGRVGGADGPVGIDPGGVGSERGGGDGVALEVRGFGLDEAHEDVGGFADLVVVEGVVLDRGAPEPGGAGGFD